MNFDDISLDILGNKIDWQRFSTAMNMKGDVLTISPTVFDDLTVKLAEKEPSVEEDAKPETAKEAEAIVLPEVWIPLTVALERFDLNRFKLEQETPIIVNHLGLEAKVGEHDVDVQALELDMPQAEADLKAKVQLKGGYPLELDLSALVKETDVAGQKLQLSAKGSVEELTLDATLSELIEAKLLGELKPLEPTLPFDLELNDGKAQWPLKGNSDYQVAIKQLKTNGSLEGFQLNLDANAKGKDIPNISLDVEGAGSTEHIDLQRLDIATLGGHVTGAVKANWKELVNWQADIGLQHIQPGLQWPEAEGDISGNLKTSGSLTEAGGWQVELPTLDIDGILREYPLNIKGQLSASDKTASGEPSVETSGLRLSHGVNAINVVGKLDKQWNMDVAIDFPELVKSVPDLRGALVGDIALSGPMKEPNVDLGLNINSVKWKDEATLDSLALNGSVTPLPAPQADIVLKANGISYQEQKVESVELKVDGGEKSHKLTLDVVSDIVSTSLAISGELVQKPSMVWKGVLERVTLSTEQGAMAT